MNIQSYTFKHRNTLDVNSEKKHKKDLGLSIPEDYFAQSKKAIMLQVKEESKTSKLIFLNKKSMVWSVAAAVALLITVAVFNPFASGVNELENDILLASVVAEDSDVDELLEDYINDELLIEEIFLE